MPYKTDKLKLDSPHLDRRTKLLPCQREMVLYWRARGLSQRQLAKLFHVSRRLITFIIDPLKHERNIEVRNNRGGSKVYYDREKHNAYMREHRRYKYKTLSKYDSQEQVS